MRARARRKEFFFLFLWTNNISIQVSIFFWRWGFDIATIIKNSLFLTFSVVPRFEFSSITIKYNLVDYRDLGAVNWTAASSLRVYRILTYLCAVFNPFAFCNENNERKSERGESQDCRERRKEKKKEREEKPPTSTLVCWSLSLYITASFCTCTSAYSTHTQFTEQWAWPLKRLLWVSFFYSI